MEEWTEERNHQKEENILRKENPSEENQNIEELENHLEEDKL